MKKISIMIPCYNEEENVIPMSEAIVDLFNTELTSYDYELLFIDNCSTDKTREYLRMICGKNKHIKAIFNARNFGQFNSPYYGLLQTTGDCVVSMCCDFQDPIEHFTGSGLYDKSFIDVLRDLKDPTPFMRGLVAELGFARKEIPYEQPQRRAGKTHNNWYTLYDAAMLSFTSYTKIGLRLATFMGILAGTGSFIVAIIYLILKLTHWNSFTAGMAPVVIGMFFLGGIQLFFLGFIGEYILSINKRVMNRPLVVEEERINFEKE